MVPLPNPDIVALEDVENGAPREKPTGLSTLGPLLDPPGAPSRLRRDGAPSARWCPPEAQGGGGMAPMAPPLDPPLPGFDSSELS